MYNFGKPCRWLVLKCVLKYCYNYTPKNVDFMVQYSGAHKISHMPQVFLKYILMFHLVYLIPLNI